VASTVPTWIRQKIKAGMATPSAMPADLLLFGRSARGLFPQGGVDLRGDVLGEIDMVADEGKQLVQCLDLTPGVVGAR
jgi:hypothetical protein